MPINDDDSYTCGNCGFRTAPWPRSAHHDCVGRRIETARLEERARTVRAIRRAIEIARPCFQVESIQLLKLIANVIEANEVAQCSNKDTIAEK